ncbi:VRR-NUC domain-containing protein [Melampsora americana]|nr:VRR-NUC domain-containing protein [Melampsora americana]
MKHQHQKVNQKPNQSKAHHQHHPSTSSISSSSSSSSSSIHTNHPLQITSDKWIPIAGHPIKPNQIQSTSTSDSTQPRKQTLENSNSVALFEDEDSIEYVQLDQKVSIYVECFESMIKTVLEHEIYLFSKHEFNLINSWNNLTYPSKYLFVRLFMRKHNKWFRIDKLKINYQNEIDDVHEACRQLAQLIQESDSEVESVSSNHLILQDLDSSMNDNHHIQSDLIDPMLLNPSSSMSHSNEIINITPPSSINLMEQVFKSLYPFEGHISSPYASFADSSSTDPEELLNCLSSIELKSLAKTLKTNIHTTRDMIIKGLLESSKNQSTLVMSRKNGKTKNERALELKFDSRGRKERQSEMLSSKVLEMIGDCIKLDPEVCTLFSRLHLIYYRSRNVTEKTMTAATLARFKLRNYPTYLVTRTSSIFESRDSLIRYERALLMEKEMEECLNPTYGGTQREQKRGLIDKVEEKQKRKLEKDQRMKKGEEIFRRAWKEWQDALEEEDQRVLMENGDSGEEDPTRYYRRQFHPAHSLTRIVQKGSEILSYYKNYQGEKEVLIALLKQRHFKRGKRGAWYERLALVLMTHFEGKQELALRVCEEALDDANTHQIYHLTIKRRLIRLKKLLGISNFTEAELILMNRSQSYPRKTLMGHRIGDEREIGKKSKWKSFNNELEQITIEELVLEHYCLDQNWNGIHSEGSILTTLYSLIFWDILFAPVPGAFETSYQSAPLDLFTDAFAIEIKSNLIKTYERESLKKTWCIGLNWEKYGLIELLEILECFGMKAMCKILKILSEEYGYRRSGVPDLCLWNYKEKKVLFVEVKGPGDRLSETQMAWLDLLSIEIGLNVEVCDVKEANEK